jgi:hypothetical protein
LTAIIAGNRLTVRFTVGFVLDAILRRLAAKGHLVFRRVFLLVAFIASGLFAFSPAEAAGGPGYGTGCIGENEYNNTYVGETKNHFENRTEAIQVNGNPYTVTEGGYKYQDTTYWLCEAFAQQTNKNRMCLTYRHPVDSGPPWRARYWYPCDVHDV